jgi:hypothetical protein
MSCWWDLDFSATGPEPLTEELKTTLPHLRFHDGARLFHHVEIMSSIPGFMVIHTCRNYHGGDAICELIARFPDLVFQGCLHSDVTYDQYTLFQSRSGETMFQEFVIADIEERLTRCPSRAELEEQLVELGNQIDRLELERKELNESLARLGSTAKCT